MRCENRGPPYAIAGGTFQSSVSRLLANLAAPLYKASLGQPRARCGLTAFLLASCSSAADQTTRLACPRAMAKNGLVICILVASLLLDQTDGYPSRAKARKHSKRRVKGNGTLLPSRNPRLIQVGKVLEKLHIQTAPGDHHSNIVGVWLCRGSGDLWSLQGVCYLKKSCTRVCFFKLKNKSHNQKRLYCMCLAH